MLVCGGGKGKGEEGGILYVRGGGIGLRGIGCGTIGGCVMKDI